MPPGHNAEKSGDLTNPSACPQNSLGTERERERERDRELTLSLPFPSTVENLRVGQTFLAINKLKVLSERGGLPLYEDCK